MKNTIIVLIALFISLSTFAQQGINYKAILKDADGNALSETPMTVQFTIHETSATGPAVYQEEHPYTTDVNGLLILTIGTGTTPIEGIFATIDWSAKRHFLRISIGYSGGNIFFDPTEFMAVPYAKHAEIATTADLATEALTADFATEAATADLATVALTANNVTTKLDQLDDAKSDEDGTDNGSSIFLGVDSGLADDGTNNRNVGVGFETLQANTFGYNNVANGHSALKTNTTGHSNVANGANALVSNTTGVKNTTNGANSLVDNTIGSSNTANGYEAMRLNTEGSSNTAIGVNTLHDNTEGDFNSAVGYEALYKNLIGDFNTAMGNRALLNNTASGNTAYGNIAMYSNISGSNNTAIGSEALYENTSGNLNTAIGYRALDENITGHNNTAIGFNAEVLSASGSNQVRIGNTEISYAGIQVDWSITSDKRWKDNIRKLPYGLDMVMQLQPVDYTRKNNKRKTREMGFIAQDLKALLTKVGYTDQGFLTKDDKGFLSVRYNDFIALLTKAIQEQQAIIDGQNEKIETQNGQIEAQENENAQQNTSITLLLQRMTALEASNNQ